MGLFGRKKKKPKSKEELDRIAGRGVSPHTKLFSWSSVYQALRNAGLSHEEAKKEADKRVISTH